MDYLYSAANPHEGVVELKVLRIVPTKQSLTTLVLWSPNAGVTTAVLGDPDYNFDKSVVERRIVEKLDIETEQLNERVRELMKIRESIQPYEY